LGSHDRYLLTLVDDGDTAALDPLKWPVFLHFEAAFFGYYLQGHQDYNQYLTADYVNSLEAQMKLGMVWGLYTKT
jgi:hypothetical protein